MMLTYIALFRGINVGGKNILPMKQLVAILEGIGMQNVKTYIQSGNAVFESTERNAPMLAKNLGSEIKNQMGFEPKILILDVEMLQKAIADNPFPEAVSAPACLHLGFMATPPVAVDLQKLFSLKKPNERFHLSERVFYLHAPEGVGKSKLSASAEKILGVTMTDRNWNTVCKLMELASA